MRFLFLFLSVTVLLGCGLERPHSGVGQLAAGFSHSPTPKTCNECHGPGKPADRFSKAKNHQPINSKDCVSCHTPVGWIKGPSATHTPIPTQCGSCHQKSQPVTPVKEMNHAAVPGMDCVNCHKVNVGTSWVGGKFSHVPAPATCNICHQAQLPSGTVPNRSAGFTHATNFGTECATCHTIAVANIGVTWSAGFFGHNGNDPTALENCTPCHDKRKHHAGTNCTQCHKSIVWPAASSSGRYGGKFGRPN